MWTKIVSCVIIVTILLYNRRVCGNVESRSVHRVQPEGDLEISKNITIHRNGYGRLLRLLALLKGIKFQQRFQQVSNALLQVFIIEIISCIVRM